MTLASYKLIFLINIYKLHSLGSLITKRALQCPLCYKLHSSFFNNKEGIASGRQSKGLRGSPDSVLYQFFFVERESWISPPRKLTVRFWSVINSNMHTSFQSQRLEQAIDIINSNTKSCTRIQLNTLSKPQGAKHLKNCFDISKRVANKNYGCVFHFLHRS